MKSLRIIYNYILFLLKIRKILPKEIVLLVKIHENGEKLTEIKSTSKLLIGSNLLDNVLRKSTHECLLKSSESLPSDYTLLLLDAFRSKERQKESWQREYKIVSEQNSGLSKTEIDRLTSLRVSAAGGSGHQTGGAVDVTLLFKGKEVDMGGSYLEFNSKTFTFSSGLTETQKGNRQILFSAMEKGGFKNFPAEWWHYSYGDRMWAAYSKKFRCFYGPIENL